MPQQNSAFEILIADGDEPFRRTLRSAIESRPDWRVCGEAVNGIDVLEKAKALRPDVVILDSAMPGFGGLQVANGIRRELPRTAVIVMSRDSAVTSEVQSGSYSDPVGIMTTERDFGRVSAALRRFVEVRRRRENGLDKTLADTFPCSDPLSSIPNPHLQS